MKALYDTHHLLPSVRGKYRFDYDLGKICWLGVGGKAEVVFIPEDMQDLIHFIQNRPQDLMLNVLGVGSNVLISDNGIAGVTIKLGRNFTNLEVLGDNKIAVGAACLDLNFAWFCQEHGVGGMEFFSGIPGTIGGAIAMNAGAYGSETANHLISAKAVNLQTGEVADIDNADFGFTYRSNKLGKEWLFVTAILQGIAGDKEQIADNIRKIQSERAATQPVKSKTGGSTFKNPPNFKAWQLIDAAGCRGLKIGGAQVSDMHCNFFINTGDATADDFIKLIKEVKARVFSNSGIMLEEEIKYL